MLRFLAIFLLLSACANQPKEKTVTINKSSWIRQGKEKARKVLAGTVLKINEDEHLVISSPASPTTIVVSAKEALELPMLEGKNLFHTDRRIFFGKKKLNHLLSEVGEIQFLMHESLLDEALSKVENLRLRYPRIAHLNFLRASILVLQGEDDVAKEILRKSLKRWPKNSKAMKLYESLGGKRSAKKSQ